jgi:hypothetical protein
MKVYNIHPVEIKINEAPASVVIIGKEGKGSKQRFIRCPKEFEYLEATPPSSGNVLLQRRLIHSTDSSGWIANISTGCDVLEFSRGEISADPKFFNKIDIVSYGLVGSFPDFIIQTELDNFWIRVKYGNVKEANILIFYQSGAVWQIPYKEGKAKNIDLANSTPYNRGDLVIL